MSDPRTTPSIFTRGAVDLGALRGTNQAPSRTPSATPATGPSPTVTGAADPPAG
ncbi:MAG TPA: co-chaperone YbbN, partial [Catenuloplanes sp.]